MSGWYRMHRGWMEHDVFGRDPLDKRSAFIWLIEHAAFADAKARGPKGRIDLKRGQLSYSLRFLAGAWGWQEPKVRRYLKATQDAKIIDAHADAGQMVITICNYDKYQSDARASDAARDAEMTQAPRVGDANNKKEEKEEEGGAPVRSRKARGPYAFEGEVVKINQAKLDEWRATYHAIPDLVSELRSIDSWLAEKALAIRDDWFRRTPRMLNKPHQEWLAKGPRGSSTSGKVIDSTDLFLRRFERAQAAEKGAG